MKKAAAGLAIAVTMAMAQIVPPPAVPTARKAAPAPKAAAPKPADRKSVV